MTAAWREEAEEEVTLRVLPPSTPGGCGASLLPAAAGIRRGVDGVWYGASPTACGMPTQHQPTGVCPLEEENPPGPGERGRRDEDDVAFTRTPRAGTAEEAGGAAVLVPRAAVNTHEDAREEEAAELVLVV